MELYAQAEIRQPTPVPFSIVTPASQPAYVLQAGPIDDLIDTYKSIAAALELTADKLVTAYNLPPSQSTQLYATIRPVNNAVNISVRASNRIWEGE